MLNKNISGVDLADCNAGKVRNTLTYKLLKNAFEEREEFI